MPLFIYKAKNQKGETQTGTQEAASEHELARALHQNHLLLLSAEKAGAKKIGAKLALSTSFSFFKRVSLTERMMFTQHLAVMVEAGLSFSQALRALSRQVGSSKFRKILVQIEDNVRQGKSFSDSLAKHPKVFNELYVNMVRVGETGGNLEEVLRLLANQMKKDHELISRVRGAMVYPGVILTAMLGVGVLMMIVVVPQLKDVFDDLEMDLPATTQAIISLSDFLQQNLIFSFIGLVTLIVVLRMFSKTKLGKKVFHKIFLLLPIFGSIIRKVNSARFARTFSSLIDSGVSIVQTIKITSGTLTNIYYKEALAASAEQVQKGRPLSQALASHGSLYPSMVVQMIQVGEETGKLSDVLKNLANFYEEEIDNITRNLSSVIEPVLMIIIGAAVGFFAISMIQPMYSMVQGI